MTDEEFDRANAEYDALPGTPPDGYSFIPEAELGEDGFAVIQGRIRSWQPEMTFCRVTDMTGRFAKDGWPRGIWLEVWRERPHKQAAFDPPLTHNASGADGEERAPSLRDASTASAAADSNPEQTS